MRNLPFAGALAGLLLGLCPAAMAQDDVTEGGRWVTIGYVTLDGPVLDVQLDRSSVKKEGAYRTYWARYWDEDALHGGLYAVANGSGGPTILMTKSVVDCAHQKIGKSDLEEVPAHLPIGDTAPLAQMTWVALTNPDILSTVCAG